MPYEADRLRMQREADDRYSVQIPGSWCKHGYTTPKLAMDDAARVIRTGVADNPERARLNEELKVMLGISESLQERLAATESAICDIEEDILKLPTGDSQELIAVGYDAIRAFDLDRGYYYERFGKPLNIAVTPYDKNRDGTVSYGEFEFMYGWNRYQMKEVN